MKNNLAVHIIIASLLFVLAGCSSTDIKEELTLSNLRCDLLENPVGIDSRNPELSWEIKSEQRNIKQTAYQILVATSIDSLNPENANIWNSGKVNSNQSVYVSYSGPQLEANKRYYWTVKVWSENGESEWSKPAFWHMGLLYYKNWSGRWIGFDRDFPWDNKVKFPTISARYFRQEFEKPADKTIKQATAYIMGLGLYELFINGEKVGNQVLSPSPTDYTKNVKYNAFDVTQNIQSGDNAVGVVLGAGRYSAMRPNYKPYKIKDFGYPKLLFNLIIEYSDGSKDVIRTANNWKGTANGPIRSNNEYDGEYYDARKEMTGWASPGFDDSNWINAEYVQEPRGEFEAQMNENMVIKDTIYPVAINELRKGVYLLDMGQNMAGWLQLKVKGNAGQKITLRFAESLQEDGEINTRPLRDAIMTDTYILNGKGVETWHPIFTYHGFKYVEISGYPGTPKLKDFVGHVVYDNMKTTGSFETSSDLLNQIHKNAFWTINATYKGIPIDCPQRNERMPWLGDRAVGCYGESYVMDNSKLYIKWLDDIMYTQKNDGCISDVAPPYFRYYSDNMTWPGTAIFVADMIYRQYGQVDPIVKHYDGMKKWLWYMRDKYMKDYILTKDSYGDWCAPYKTIEEGRGKSADVKHPSQIIATAYFYHFLQMMQDFASLTGNNQDINEYKELAVKVKEAFNKEFFDTEKGYYGDKLLTDNLLALYFNLTNDQNKEQLIKSIREIIEVDNNGHLSVGLVGAQWLMRSLTENNMEDLAWKLATNTTYPSWGYMVKNGATSIWELWNATTAAPKMNSQNHVMMLGDLIIWYYEDIAGIKTDSKKTGFKKIIMNPLFPKDLDQAQASYASIYGTIKSHWIKNENGLQWNISIPANTTATVYLPETDQDKISESQNALKDAYGILSINNESGKLKLELGSGDYQFNVNN